VAIITGAIYLLWAYQRVFQGRITNPANEGVRDISWRELGAVAPLIAGIVFLGVYPKPFLDRVTPSVNYMLNRVERIAPNADVPASTTRNVTFSVPANQDVMPPATHGGTASSPAPAAPSASGATNGGAG
jgi:NADH-quinone oxidoreductase subunit M